MPWKKIRWKINSEDEHFTDAIFVEKAKEVVASFRRPASNNENVNVNVEVSEESSDEEASDEDLESVSDSHEASSHEDNTEKEKDYVSLIPLHL